MLPYIPLRNHSSYSLLEGSLSVDQLLSMAQEQNVPALGLADTGHLFGAMEFSLKCRKKGIQPLLGCQLSLKSEILNGCIVAYAKNAEGYRSLCHLVTSSTVSQPADLRGYVTAEQLEEHSKGLLILTGGARGPVDSLLSIKKEEEAYNALIQLSNMFGDRLYIEVSRYTEPAQTENQLVEWAYALGLPLLATNEAFFGCADDFEANDVLRCVAQGRYVQETDRPRLTPEYHFKDPQNMNALFEDLPEALLNTVQFRERCGFLLEGRAPSLPSFPCDGAEEDVLCAKAQNGLKERLEKEVIKGKNPEEQDALRTQYTQRLDYELSVIIKMGFSGYFLIVADFIQWAKNQNIPVGPGRGSGAGSLVAWCLRITDLDPLKFGLFFERFLNPERVSLPDFDVDFCQERRDEVIAYVAQKYGAQHVAHIITFGSLQARAVLRDVGRALQMPYGQVDRICKMIPHHPTIDLEEALRLEPAINALAKEDETVERLLRIGKKLEGLYRHASVHAAGVIISKEPLTDVLPLYQDDSATLPATEFSMKYAEEAGLIKFDFLGLKTLTVLQHAVHLVAQRGITVDLLDIPLTDPATFSLLCRVETVGLFQLESTGMSEVLRQLQPETFDELIALVALYRPGPMDDIPRYIACRHQRETVHYAYDCLEDILRSTFGVMVYQEQVLQIAQKLAGYTMGAADLLRRAMGKKIPEEMRAQREIFIAGVLKNHGGSEEEAKQLFDQIAKFASYAFPKAHAATYALIAYQTAYMKANYPAEFMAALMTLDLHNTDKIRLFAREVQKMNIPLLPPDVNRSQPIFSVESMQDGTLGMRYGLSAIKNVGVGVMEQLCEERQKNGVFKDIFDVMRRVPSLNKKHLETLIGAGALDSLRHERHDLSLSMDLLLDSSKEAHAMDQLFATAPKSLRSAAPWSLQERLQQEYQALGFYFTAHPLDPVWPQEATLFDKVCATQKTQTMAGIIMGIKERVGKSGKRFAFVSLSDPSGDYEVVCFSDVLNQSRSFLQVGEWVVLHVDVRMDGESLRFLAQEVRPLGREKREAIYVVRSDADVLLLQQALMHAPSGWTTVRLKIMMDGAVASMVLPKTYDICKDTQKMLAGFA